MNFAQVETILQVGLHEFLDKRRDDAPLLGARILSFVDQNVVDAEITVLTGPGHTTTDVEWRRLRAAERALLAAWLVFLAGRRPDTGKAVA